MGKLDYQDIDPNIRALVRALNSFPGVETIGSCGGHDNPGPGQEFAGCWRVSLVFKTPQVLEFFAWMINDDYPSPVFLYPFAPPPQLNGFGNLRYVIRGFKGSDPDDLATFVVRMRDEEWPSAEEWGNRQDHGDEPVEAAAALDALADL